FRGWLIAQGEEVYENAIVDPESLVGLIDVNEDAQKGFLHNVFRLTYEQITGQEVPRGIFKDRKPAVLRGEHWPQAKLEARFPKLTAKFGDCDQRWKRLLVADLLD